MRNEPFAIRGSLAVLCAPTMSANVQTFVGVFLIEQERMKKLFVGKRFLARFTDVRPGLNIPIDHELSLITPYHLV
jgi:hypothetical protein